MRPMILIFNLPEDQLTKLRFTCMRLGIQVRKADAAEQGETIAALCGMTERASAPAPEAPFSDALLVMANFSQPLANKLLAALKQARLTIRLKAVVTPTNALWDAVRLHSELAAERAAIEKGGKAEHRA